MSVNEQLAALTGTAGSIDADTLPGVPGAYLILIGLDKPLPLAGGKRTATSIPAGEYVYAGSARGPGGIRARAARHLRADKHVHWHVDRLTIVAASLAAYPVPGGSECDLVDRLLKSSCFEVPLPGFGSSDCRHCASHLLRWTGG